MNWTGAPGATGANNDVADGEHDIENDGMVVTHEDEDEEEWEDEEEDRFWTTLRLPPRFVRKSKYCLSSVWLGLKLMHGFDSYRTTGWKSNGSSRW